jgi:iron complex transport system ATP-binding protein
VVIILELVIQNLSFKYLDREVLHDISLTLKNSGLVGILGPNGVGKSTLVQCIDRILEITGGDVTINGKRLREYKPKELAKIVSYVPCSTSETFPMTVLDTILVGRQPNSGWRLDRADFEVVQGALEFMDIEDLALRHFNELSAGQRQKVMLARGYAQHAEILLLDEPTANLDIKHQYSVSKRLKRLSQQEDVMVIMVCHDLNIAAKYCDRLILMKDGTIYADGDPTEIITERNIKDVYGVDCRILVDDGRPFVVVNDDNLERVSDLECVPHSISYI